MLRLKRVYEPPAPEDGLRILVDRLWPRGVRKTEARVDLWPKEIAPTAELRRWFGHDPKKWGEFRSRYDAELRQNSAAIDALSDRIQGKSATLLYAAADTEHNNAVVLRDVLGETSRRR